MFSNPKNCATQCLPRAFSLICIYSSISKLESSKIFFDWIEQCHFTIIYDWLDLLYIANYLWLICNCATFHTQSISSEVFRLFPTFISIFELFNGRYIIDLNRHWQNHCKRCNDWSWRMTMWKFCVEQWTKWSGDIWPLSPT